MRRIRLFHTESFRLASLFALLFMGLATLLIGAVYWIVADMQSTALLTAVDADLKTIQNGYREKGLPEAIEVVNQRLGMPHERGDVEGQYLLLMDQTQTQAQAPVQILAGNLPLMKPRFGVFVLQKPNPAEPDQTWEEAKKHGVVLGKGVWLTTDVYLFAGRDTASIVAMRTRILHAFGWIIVGTIVVAALGGIFFGVQFMRRIDAITKTCHAIVAGNFADRIALRGSDDELDRLGRAINSMLDRISALLDNLRQVSSDVAHDLRTPLTHLRQRLENARQQSTTMDDYAQAVTHAIGDTDKLLAMFTALLRISQIEAGTRLKSFADLNLSDLLNRVYEMYRPVAEDHGHTLQREVAPGVTLRGDGELLTQLFVNLIENALAHTPAGSRIIIKLAVEAGTVVASVLDNGPGIPLAEREKVFRRFYRMMASRTTPGHGLGLPLVAAIANLHQAKVALSDQAPGLGVSVTFAKPQ